MAHLPVHDQTKFQERRKQLRKRLTKAEATLWNLLKGKQLEGRKLRRQHSVGKYILDFYCYAEKLAIELDGEHHFTDEGLKYDEERTDDLNTFGIRVLRFENDEIFQSPEDVLHEIKRHFKQRV